MKNFLRKKFKLRVVHFHKEHYVIQYSYSRIFDNFINITHFEPIDDIEHWQPYLSTNFENLCKTSKVCYNTAEIVKSHIDAQNTKYEKWLDAKEARYKSIKGIKRNII